jgi:hypothetical protein
VLGKHLQAALSVIMQLEKLNLCGSAVVMVLLGQKYFFTNNQEESLEL